MSTLQHDPGASALAPAPGWISLLVWGLVLAFALVVESTPDRGFRGTFYALPPAPPLTTPPKGARPGLARLDYSDASHLNLTALAVDRRIAHRWLDLGEDDFQYRSFTWRGWLDVPAAGVYEVGTVADDNAVLVLDDAVAIARGSLNSREIRRTKLHLARGYHRLELEYFQLTGPAEMRLEWIPPGAKLTSPREGREVIAQERFAYVPPQPFPDPPSAPSTGEPSARVLDWLAALSQRSALPPLGGAVMDPWCFVDVLAPPPEGTSPQAWAGSQQWSSATTAPPRMIRHAVSLAGTASNRRLVHVVQQAGGPFEAPAAKDVTGAPDAASLHAIPGWAQALKGGEGGAPPGAIGGIAGRGVPVCEEVRASLAITDPMELVVPYLDHWDVARLGYPATVPALHAVWESTLDCPAGGPYTFVLRGRGMITLRVGPWVLQKGPDATEASFNLALEAAPIPISVEATAASRRTVVLLWKPPGGVLSPIPPGVLALPSPGHARFIRTACAIVVAVLLSLAIAWVGGPWSYLCLVRRQGILHVWAVLLLLGLVLRLHHYERVPPPGETWDEFNAHMIGMSLLEGDVPLGWDFKEGYPVRQEKGFYGWQVPMVAPMVHYPPLGSLMVALLARAAGARSPFELRLHATRLLPIACAGATLAMMLPVGRAVGLTSAEALLGMAFLAIYPTAVVGQRLVKEDSLLAPLFLLLLWMVASYRRGSGAPIRFAIGLTIVAGLLTKQLGIILPALAIVVLLRRGHRGAAVLCALYALVGTGLFFIYGLHYGGSAFLAVQRQYTFYATHLDALWFLIAENTVTEIRICNSWNLGLWIVFAMFVSHARRRPRRAPLTAAVLVALVVLVATVPAQLNYGWYRLPLLPVLALVFGAQTRRLFQSYGLMESLVWTGLFALPAINVLMLPVSLPAYGPLVYMTEPQKSNIVFRCILALLVGPGLLVWLLPRRFARPLSRCMAALLLVVIAVCFVAISWSWGDLFPSPALW